MDFTGADFADFLAGVWLDLWNIADADLFSLAFRLLLLWLLFWFGRMLLVSAWRGIAPRNRLRLPRLFPPVPTAADMGKVFAEQEARRAQREAEQAEQRCQAEAKEAAALATLADTLTIKPD